MKPRMLCAECQNDVQWGVGVCPSCGKPVEWPEEAVSEGAAGAVTARAVCTTCGSENAAEADFCGSCGARLDTQGTAPSGKQQSRQARPAPKQGKARVEKKDRESSSPLFSSKVIFGFLGVLLILVVALEFFPSRGQQPAQPTSATPQPPAANMELVKHIDELEQRVAANPTDMQSLLTLANVCQDGRFFDKAIVQYRKYLGKNPRDANARVDMGICFFESSNLDEARKEMEMALKYEPKHVAAHFNLGIVNLRAGKVPDANEWFKKTIALAPSSEMGQQAKKILEQHSSPLTQNK
jgi:cytochrome c-type biogenesis protein CcmH/NrfG